MSVLHPAAEFTTLFTGRPFLSPSSATLMLNNFCGRFICRK